MNSTNVIEYIKIAYWVLKSKQSIQDCLKLNESVEAITENITNIINDTSLNQELCNIIPNVDLSIKTPAAKKKKPSEQVSDSILKNMETYNTTLEEAQKYETHCHKCGGDKIIVGQKYCSEGCCKVIERFNYKCFWGSSCKMCHTHQKYIVMTHNFEFTGKTYWIDDEQNVYNNENERVAFVNEGNIMYT